MSAASARAEAKSPAATSASESSGAPLIPTSNLSELLRPDTAAASRGFRVLLHQQNQNVCRKFVLTAVLMFALPVLTYYAFDRFLLKTAFPIDDVSMRSVWSGLAAIAMVKVISWTYAYKAFREDEQAKKRT